MSIRRHPRTFLSLAAALAATTLVLAVAAPALAARTTRSDPADAGGSLSDLRRVSVNHGPEVVLVKVRFSDLRPTSEAGSAGMAIYLDTRRGRLGPELRLDTGLQSGTDYQLTRARDWRSVGEPLTCAHGLELDFGADLATFRVARSCLGYPAGVRVAVKMVDQYDGSHPVTDWIGNRGSFTSSVASD